MNNIDTANKALIKLNDIKNIMEKRNEKYFSWLRNLITISVGLLGILISFKTGKIDDFLSALFFIITISGIALGILFGVIVLHGEVHLLDKIRLKHEEALQNIVVGKPPIIYAVVSRHSVYVVSEKICYFSFITSIISIIIYSIFTTI